MSEIKDEDLRVHAARARGKVVLITGGANGLGKSIGLEFARAGAKLVICDLDLAKAEETVAEFKALGASAIAQKADVTSWEDQLSLFQTAVKTFGRVDIVVANAGVAEVAPFDPLPEIMADVPSKPILTTINVNLIGVIYTAKLALFYFLRSSSDYKALILIGSMASVAALPGAPMYGTSKHGVLGLGRVLATTSPKDTRICTVGPWFADTQILNATARRLLKGSAFAPVDRIGGVAFLAATDPDYTTHGSYYTIPDGSEAFRVSQKEIGLTDVGMYKTLQDRVDRIFNIVNPVKKAVVRTRQTFPLFVALLAILLSAWFANGKYHWV